MNLQDRDLGVIGAGAFLTVLCLLFSWPFLLRVIVGLVILVVFMIAALARFGPDRLTLEESLKRRLAGMSKPKAYTYGGRQKAQGPAARRGAVFARPEPALSPGATALPRIRSLDTYRPVSFAWEEVGVYRLATIWLAVIGIYFIYWLVQGGTVQIGTWMKSILNVP